MTGSAYTCPTRRRPSSVWEPAVRDTDARSSATAVPRTTDIIMMLGPPAERAHRGRGSELRRSARQVPVPSPVRDNRDAKNTQRRPDSSVSRSPSLPSRKAIPAGRTLEIDLTFLIQNAIRFDLAVKQQEVASS